jgi:hypothetical protein
MKENIMKSKITLVIAGLLLLTAIAAGFSIAATSNPQTAGIFGSQGAAKDTDLTLEKMLVYAVQDENLARAEYAAIMAKFGQKRPFSNIIKAEETHINLLKGLYDTRKMAIPQDTAATHVVVPATMALALEAGVQAEISNIAMYDLFLKKDLPDDVKSVFTRLRDASKNHLAAFKQGGRSSR